MKKSVAKKKCNCCNRELPPTDQYFHKHKGFKDGLRQPCISCRSIKKERKKYYIEIDGIKTECKKCTGCGKVLKADKSNFNKERRGYLGLGAKCKCCLRLYREKNKEHLSKYKKEYNQRNKLELAIKTKEYAKRTWSARREYIRKWNQENKHKKAIYKQRRKARKEKVESDYTIENWESCKDYFNNSCSYCGKVKKLEQDHFIPLSSGGEYTINNIVPACKSCNCSKHINDFFEWYPKQKYYSKQRERRILKYLNYNEDKIQQLSIL